MGYGNAVNSGFSFRKAVYKNALALPMCSHWHDGIEFNLFIEGKTRILFNTHNIQCEKEDLAVINRHDFHIMEVTASPSVFYCLELSDEFLKNNGINPDIKFELKIQDNIANARFKAIAEINENRRTDDPFYNAKMHKAILEFLIYLGERYTSSSSMQNTNNAILLSLQKTINYIHQHYNNKITVAELAKTAGYSEAYLSGIFKSETGMTIVNYINHVRCFHARKLLENTDKPVSEILYLCGFKNESYFTKTYKQYIGNLPSHQRKKAD